MKQIKNFKAAKKGNAMKTIKMTVFFSILFTCVLISSISLAGEIKDIKCSHPETADLLNSKFDSNLENMTASLQIREENHKKEINKISDDKIQRGVWTEKEKSEFYTHILASEEFLTIETKKQKALQEFLVLLQRYSDLKAKNEKTPEKARFGLCIYAKNSLIKYRTLAQLTDEQWNLIKTKMGGGSGLPLTLDGEK